MTSRQRSAGTISLTADTNYEFLQVRNAIASPRFHAPIASGATYTVYDGGCRQRDDLECIGEVGPPERLFAGGVGEVSDNALVADAREGMGLMGKLALGELARPAAQIGPSCFELGQGLRVPLWRRG